MRLRAVGGYGAYSYWGPRAASPGSDRVEFEGSATFADALVGYHKQLGPLTLKAFVGVMAAEHDIAPDDPNTAISGSGVGGKVVLEGWWTISERAWSSLDLAWGSLHDSYSARARLGWRLLPAFSAGLEAGAAGNVECDIARAGVFVRYEWASGEVAISGGWSNDQLLQDLGDADTADASVPFATLTWLTRF